MKNPLSRLNLQKIKQPLGFKYAISLMILATLVLAGVSGWYWYNSIFTNPNRILSDMLDKSMQTESVYRKITQKSTQSDVEQSTLTGFTPQTVAQSVSTLSESGPSGVTSVTTETIGTKDTDYVRYIDINVAGANPNQKFENVLNVWGKRGDNNETGEAASFLDDALFVVVPFGNLNNDQRDQMKDTIKEVNLYNYTRSQLEYANGRPVMTYDLTVEPKALIQVLAKYVEVTGVGDNSQLNPAMYEGAAPVPLTLEVDVISRHVKSIEFRGSNRTEEVLGYNSSKHIQLPTETITVSELQNRLQVIESQQTQTQSQ